MAVDCRKVAGRRVLRFETLNDVVADLDFLEGKNLKAIGNWTVGQILVHLSVPMNGGIDGLEFPIPWYFKLLGRLFKRRLIHGKMPPGFKLPEEAEEVLVPSPTVTEAEGFRVLRKAIARLMSESHRAPHLFLGRITADEHNALMCRHCELHLSFIIVEK